MSEKLPIDPLVAAATDPLARKRWPTTRRHGNPYTQAGIERLTCIRAGCNNRAFFQWNICADDNHPRQLCKPCDIELNAMVLAWAGHPQAGALMEAYKARVL